MNYQPFEPRFGGRKSRAADVLRQSQGVRLRDVLERENRAHLRQVLDLCRPRLGGEEPRRFPHPPGRRPAGDLLPRPRRRGPCAVQHLPASRRAGLPRARGQRPAVPLHLSRLDLQHGRPAQVGVPGDDAYPPGFDKDADGPRRRCRGSRTTGISSSPISIADAVDLAHLSRQAPRTTSTSSSISRRPARWRSSPARRNTTSRPTGSCWSRTASTIITCHHALDLAQLHAQFRRQRHAAQGPSMLPTKGFGKDLGNGHLTTDNPNYRGRPVARWISVYGEDAKADIDAIRKELVAAARRGARGPRRRHQPQSRASSPISSSTTARR